MMIQYIIHYYHNACSVRDAIVFPLFSVFGNDLKNTLHVDAYFFENGGKKYPFSKTSGYVWTGPKSLHFVHTL